VSKKGDKKRLKQREKQRADAQRRRPADAPPPEPKPRREPKRSRAAAGQQSKWMGLPEPLDPESPEGPLTPRKVSESEYMTMAWPPDEGAPPGAPSIQFLSKITKRTVDLTSETLTFDMKPVEDTIHPRELSFNPPLQRFGKNGAKGFRHHWEKLDYAFGLPDPSAFPQLNIQGDDRGSVLRFIEVCQRLAKFSVINDNTRLRGRKDATDGEWHIQVSDYPSDESFVGASALFRQLHNDGEPACFTNAHNALFKAMRTLPDDQRDAAKGIVLQWKEARGKLMNHTLQTLTAVKVVDAGKTDNVGNITLESQVSYGNVNPDTLIRTFNYGDSLHFGDARTQLDDLMADPFHEAYYKYAALLSIVGLSHLYFGFAELLASALGSDWTVGRT